MDPGFLEKWKINGFWSNIINFKWEIPFSNWIFHLKMLFSILKWVPMGVMGPWGRRRRPQTPMGPIGTHFKMENPIFQWEIPF